MLVYTFDKLLLVEQLVERSLQAEAKAKIGTADRAKLFYILIAEADNFTHHLQQQLRRAWKYAPGAAADAGD
jgi:hypothetical protein